MIRYIYLIFFVFAFRTAFGQFLENPSFESQSSKSNPPSGWVSCNEFSTPDTQPGIWNVNNLASHGDTYISLVTRGDNGEDSRDRSVEDIGTKLLKVFNPNVCYSFSIDLSYAPDFDDLWFYPDWKPVKVQIWVGQSECEKEKMIWSSPIIKEPIWKGYSFNFIPQVHYNYLMIEAMFDEGRYYNGNILVDNLKIEEPLTILPDIDTTICLGDSIELVADDSYENSFLWNTGSTKRSIYASEAGNYNVQIESSCEVGERSFKVSVKECCKVEIPNVFTPNDDGFNDIFHLEGKSNLVDFNFNIYSRWGAKVHHSNDPFIIWNGKIDREDAAAGIYYWTSSFKCREGGGLKRKEHKGLLHLLR